MFSDPYFQLFDNDEASSDAPHPSDSARQAHEQTLETLERRTQELMLLHTLALRLSRAIEPQQAMKEGLDIILALTRANAIGVFLVDLESWSLELVAQKGITPQIVDMVSHGQINPAIVQPDFDIAQTQNPIEYILATRRVLTDRSLQELTGDNLAVLRNHGYNALLGFPILFDNRVYGLVGLGAHDSLAFDEHTVQLAENISALLGLSLHNARMIANSMAQVKQMEAVVHTGKLLQSAPHIPHILPHVVSEIKQTLGASYVVVQFLRDGQFELVAASDSRESKQKHSISPYEWRLLDTDAPLLVADRSAVEVDPDQRAILERLHMHAAIGIRLSARNNTFGILFVNQDIPRKWQDHEIRLIAAFAHQIADALESHRLLENSTGQVNELKALARVGKMIAAATPPDSALDAVTNEIARVFGADYVGLHLRDEDLLRLVAESELTHGAAELPIFPHQHRILSELDPVRVTNREVDAVHPTQLEYLRKFNIMADLGVALVSGQQALGILYICQRTPRNWTDEQVQLAGTFAQQIASALVNARLLREMQTQVRDLRALALNANLIARSRSPETALPQAASDLRRVLRADYVGFHLVEGDEFRVVTEAHQRYVNLRYPFKSYHKYMLEHYQKLVTNDREHGLLDDTYRKTLEEYGFRADVGIPMVTRGKTIGVLFVSQRKPRRWLESEVHLIESYAQQIAAVLDNVQILNDTEQRVSELTQLVELNELTTSILDEDILIDMALVALQQLSGADRVTLTTLRNGTNEPTRSSDGVVHPDQPMPMTKEVEQVLHLKRPLILDPNNPNPLGGGFPERSSFHQAKSYLLVPLLTAAESLGVVGFVYRSEHSFTERETRVMQAAVNQVSMAIANARLIQEQKSRIEKLDRLNEFSLWCGTLHDSKLLMDRAALRTLELLDVSATSIRLWEDGILSIGSSAGYHYPAARAQATRFGIENSGGEATGTEHPIIDVQSLAWNARLDRILNKHKAYPIHNLANEPELPEAWSERQEREGFRSALMLPMIAESKVMGILTCFQRSLHSWTESEIQYAQTTANSLALALANLRQIEIAQRTSQELRATLDSFFSGVFTTDLQGRIVSWNRAAQDMTGYTPQDMQDKAWHIEGPRLGEQKRDDTIVLEAMAEGTVCYSLALRTFICSDGRVIELREAAAPLRDINGIVSGGVCAFWNRTEEQSAERAKSDYISLAGHQLNSKLSAMIWSAEQLSRPDLSPGNREQLIEIIGATLVDLREFNKQFVEFQREHSQKRVETNPIDLRSFLRGKIAVLKVTHPSHRFQIRGDFAPVVAEALRLNVVIDNLLENAVKYSPDGSLISVRGFLADETTQQVEIHNGGEPIPSDLVDNLFERGHRGNVSKPGTGLGLWLARTKLHEMGGDISVKSRARHGTTFLISLTRSTKVGLTEPNSSAAT